MERKEKEMNFTNFFYLVCVDWIQQQCSVGLGGIDL